MLSIHIGIGGDVAKWIHGLALFEDDDDDD
jgi:hypothetical protein